MVGAGTIRPGDVVILLSGTHSTINFSLNNSGTSGSPIIFRSSSQYGFVIDGTIDAGGNTHRGFNILGNYYTFDGIYVHDAPDIGVGVGGTGNTLINSKIYHNGWRSTVEPPTGGPIPGIIVSGSNATIDSCESYGNEGHGVYVTDTDAVHKGANATIRKCLLHDNGDTANSTGGTCIQFNGNITGGLVELNFLYNSYRQLINLNTAGQNGITFRNNLGYYNAATALFFTPVTTSQAMVVVSAGIINHTWYNNLFYKQGTGLGPVFAISGSNNTGWTMVNNIGVTSGNRVAFDVMYSFSSTMPTGWTVDNNGFWLNGGANDVARINGVGTNLTTWNGLGFDTHGVSADPVVSGPTDYHFTGSSPSSIRQGGQDLRPSGVTTDLDGNARGTPNSMGCYI
jgi:hypothetical protein